MLAAGFAALNTAMLPSESWIRALWHLTHPHQAKTFKKAFIQTLPSLSGPQVLPQTSLLGPVPLPVSKMHTTARELDRMHDQALGRVRHLSQHAGVTLKVFQKAYSALGNVSTAGNSRTSFAVPMLSKAWVV